MRDLFATSLFHDVQMQKVFADGKTFVDSTSQISVEEIEKFYIEQKSKEGFNLKDFVLKYFQLPESHSISHESDVTKTVEENIEALWPLLTREPDKKNGSLISLPYSYIVPGGRFGEIYYWDSYFTMLGLHASGKYEMIEKMVNNFSYLIDEFEYIPNGNRTYFLGRSQPPFYSLMIKLLAEIKDENVWVKYLPQLEKEYNFWMKDAEQLDDENNSVLHVVKLKDGAILNRYWDTNETPRPESYREDLELSHVSTQNSSVLFRHLRAGAESGWDFSSRWFENENDFSTIQTADIIPVDLNCLLFHLETKIGYAYSLKNDLSKSAYYYNISQERKKSIIKYCWNSESKFFFDYNFINSKIASSYTLAALSPLFFEIADDEHAAQVALQLEKRFLFDGGLTTTLINSGQQWDAPNGWAPLHWMAVIGLENYGHTALAEKIARRWIKLNKDVFKRTGKLMEKYNVIDTSLEAGGGEYEGQDGFGWTNGVLLAMIKKYEHIR